ncbi:MAG: hypothetical protein M3441_01045 [Chloroflexota bacterium]|nr:hypothetical protein [Chloroflexota bacterium]
MFEAISFREGTSNALLRGLDWGTLAEALIFYDKVHVILSPSNTLADFLRRFDPYVLANAVEEGHINLTYMENSYALLQAMGDGPVWFAPGAAGIDRWQFDTMMPQVLEEVTGNAKAANDLASRLGRKTAISGYDDAHLMQAMESFTDAERASQAVASLLQFLEPETRLAPGQGVIYRLVSSTYDGQQGFNIESNIDFSMLPEQFAPESLAFILLAAQQDTYYAAMHSSEVVTEPLMDVVHRSTIQTILQSRGASDAQIEYFQDFYLADAHAIAEAVKSGGRSFKDVIKLRSKSAPFRSWMADKPFDANLVKDYYREVSKARFFDKLPGKGLRWSIFTGGGIALDAVTGVPVVSLGLGLFDTFVLDRLRGGWKPSHFVEKELRRFVKVDISRQNSAT